MKKPAELIAFCKSKLGCGYVFGCNGHVLTESLLKTFAARYPQMYTAAYIERTRRWLGKESFDCSGLIDVALGVDYNANGYYANAKEKSKILLFNDVPDLPGVLLFKSDSSGHMYHIGVYIGNGRVIEARGVDYGVIERDRTSAWTHWGKCHLIDYGTESTMLLKNGSTGDEVKALQTNLNKCIAAGLLVGTALLVDGDFGGKTETLVRALQTKYKLNVDGVAGEQTQALITTLLTPVVVPPIVDYLPALNAANAQIDALENQITALNEKVSFLTNALMSEQLRVNQLIADLATANTTNDLLIADLRTLSRIINKYSI